MKRPLQGKTTILPNFVQQLLICLQECQQGKKPTRNILWDGYLPERIFKIVTRALPRFQEILRDKEEREQERNRGTMAPLLLFESSDVFLTYNKLAHEP